MEGLLHLQGLAIRPEGSLSPRSEFLLFQPPLLPLFSSHTEESVRVTEFERLPGNKHVPGWEPGVGPATFIQNHYHVLHVAVHRVNMEVGENVHPTPTA